MASTRLAAATGAFVPASASIATSSIAETLAEQARKTHVHLHPNKITRIKEKTLPNDVMRWGIDIRLSQLCWMHPPQAPHEGFAHICILIAHYGMNYTAHICLAVTRVCDLR